MQKNDKAELERRLEQIRRLSADITDALTRQRLEELAREIREQLDSQE